MRCVPMPDFSAPFVVEASFRLPGLGLLVLPAAPEPDWLLAHSLHTALAVTMPSNIPHSSSIIGTIEEIAHEEQPQRQALLLDFDPGTSMSPGICLRISEVPSELY